MDDAALRGALRLVQMREGAHARLLEARIKELGGSCSAEVEAERFDATMARLGGEEVSDVDKLKSFKKRHPDPERGLAPLQSLIEELDGDRETQSLLRAIADDEEATLDCFAAHRKRLKD